MLKKIGSLLVSCYLIMVLCGNLPQLEAAKSTVAIDLRQVLSLVNQERSKAGLSPLHPYALLDEAADRRAKELPQLFSHDRPGGKEWFTVLGDFNISYKVAAENIAYGTDMNAVEVVNAWMNSPGHRANILSPDLTYMGIGCYRGEDRLNYWAQLFITEETD